MGVVLMAGEMQLPSPVSLQIDNELIWSSDSGRDLSGLFSGDIVAEKKALTIGWGVLQAGEVNLIETQLCPGYFPLKFCDAGGIVEIEAYRGTLSKVLLGEFGDGYLYYKSASCKIVQR